MKRFSDFATDQVALEGDKARLEDIIDQSIVVTGYRVRGSRYGQNGNSEYLTLQFEWEGKTWIVFTGSKVLTEQIQKYSHEIPFQTVIRRISRYYSFT